MTPDEARHLAERVRRGDPAAEEALVCHFAPRVQTMLAVRIGDSETARDLCQDVLIAVLTALRAGSLRDGESLVAYVHGTARNLASTYLRVGARQPRPLLGELPATNPTSDPLETSERRNLVRQELARLEPRDRAILELTLREGLKPTEIGRRLGLGPELVRQRKSRAIRRIAERIATMTRRGRGDD